MSVLPPAFTDDAGTLMRQGVSDELCASEGQLGMRLPGELVYFKPIAGGHNDDAMYALVVDFNEVHTEIHDLLLVVQILNEQNDAEQEAQHVRGEKPPRSRTHLVGNAYDVEEQSNDDEHAIDSALPRLPVGVDLRREAQQDHPETAVQRELAQARLPRLKAPGKTLYTLGETLCELLHGVLRLGFIDFSDRGDRRPNRLGNLFQNPHFVKVFSPNRGEDH